MRRIHAEWVRRAIEVVRWTRVSAYALIACAGVASVLWPPPSVQAASDGVAVALIWAGLMAVSAAFCAFGAASDRWVGEYIGLVPLALTAMIFAVSAFARGQMSWSGGTFLLGFSFWIITRWQEVALLRVEAERKARERSDGGTA